MALPVNSSIPSQNGNLKKILVAGGILVLALLLGFLVWRPPILLVNIASSVTLPTPLQHAIFSLSENDRVVLYKKDGFRFVRMERDGNVTAMAQGTNGNVYLEVPSATSTIMFLHVGDKAVTLTTPAYSVSASPNQKNIAFAEKNNPSDPVEMRRWRIQTFSVDFSTEPGAFSTGVIAYYINDTNLIRFTEGGIYKYDFLNRTSTLLHAENFLQKPSFVSLSPDRTLIGWTDIFTRTTTIYKITPSKLEKVASFNRKFAGNAVLGNDVLYEVRPVGSKSELWQIQFDSSEKLLQVLPFAATSIIL